MKDLLPLVFCLGVAPLWGQLGAHCDCPQNIEARASSTCPGGGILYVPIAPGQQMDPYRYSNVAYDFTDVNNLKSCTGTLTFSDYCGSGYMFAPLPSCYTKFPAGGIGLPSGTLTMPNGLTCTYRAGVLSGHAPTTCPIDCSDVLPKCVGEMAEYAEDFLNISYPCKQWIGPCNTESLIYRMGPVSIGAETPHLGWNHRLAINGGILTEQVKICQTEWCDYVFEPDYCLRSLEEVSDFLRDNGHLPGCTPGKTIEREGGFAVEREVKNQQEKIEEIFLHLIALEKQLEGDKPRKHE